ncbi:MAG: M67 family metallopeptidase [Thermoproteus sp.]
MDVPRRFLDEAERRCTPREECAALLFGTGDRVELWRWLENAAGSPYEFKLRPEDVYKAVVDAEALGAELVAIFHTHPGPPTPSRVDLKYMMMWPVVWIIRDVYTGEVRGWRLRGARLESVNINILE